MKTIKKQLANALTSMRIVLSVALIFIAPLTPMCLIIYALCGITDMFDGTVARKLGTTGKTGALLDSIADIVFVAVCAARFIPKLCLLLPIWWMYFLLIIVCVKLISLIVGCKKFKKPCFLHTYLNKLAGFAVFVLPFISTAGFFKYLFAIVCAVSFIAAVEELVCIIKMKEYNADIKGVCGIN